jgi:hypothetical protein
MGGVTDTDAVAFRGRISHGSAKHGVFIFGATDDTVVLNTDPVPTDLWGTTAVYRNIDEDIDVSASGTWVAFVSKVRDRQTPNAERHRPLPLPRAVTLT